VNEKPAAIVREQGKGNELAAPRGLRSKTLTIYLSVVISRQYTIVTILCVLKHAFRPGTMVGPAAHFTLQGCRE
jgi:hypothetical protein